MQAAEQSVAACARDAASRVQRTPLRCALCTPYGSSPAGSAKRGCYVSLRKPRHPALYRGTRPSTGAPGPLPGHPALYRGLRCASPPATLPRPSGAEDTQMPMATLRRPLPIRRRARTLASESIMVSADSGVRRLGKRGMSRRRILMRVVSPATVVVLASLAGASLGGCCGGWVSGKDRASQTLWPQQVEFDYFRRESIPLDARPIECATIEATLLRVKAPWGRSESVYFPVFTYWKTVSGDLPGRPGIRRFSVRFCQNEELESSLKRGMRCEFTFTLDGNLVDVHGLRFPRYWTEPFVPLDITGLKPGSVVELGPDAHSGEGGRVDE